MDMEFVEINLGRGNIAKVDADIIAGLLKHRWCWYKDYKTKYAVASINGKSIKMHRLQQITQPNYFRENI